MRPELAPGRAGRSRARHRGRLRDGAGAAVAFPLSLYIIGVLRHTPANSPAVFYRPFFILQYANGIYRYRILGRELVVGISNLFNLVVGGPRITGISAATHGVEASMFASFVVVNGAALLGFSILLYVVTVRRREWLPAYLILVALTAMSSYVVTPYDFLSYLLIALALVVALSGRPRSWAWCIPIAILGTATRESFLVVVAALVAVRISAPGSIRELGLVPRREDTLWQSTEAVAVCSVGTYVALRVVLNHGTDPSTFFQSAPGVSNLNWASLVALVIVALGAFAFDSQIPREGAHTPSRAGQRRTALLLLWLFSLPYLFVSAYGGIWSEALRLVLPVGICHYVISWAFTDRGPDVIPRTPGSSAGEATPAP